MSEEFRIGIGGPFHRVEHAAHLMPARRLIAVAIGITWCPLIALSLAEWLIARRSDPILLDLSVHVRLLIALPLLVFAERLLDLNCRGVMSRLFDEGYIAVEDEARVRKLLRSVERWRDSPLPELLLMVVAVFTGIAALAGILPPAGVIHGVNESRYSPTHAWYALISLPLFQFLLWRSLFRWALWVRVLVGLAYLPLCLLPAHADRCAGIGFIKRPSIVYCAVFLLAVSCVLCGGWATQIVLYGAKVEAFKPLFFAFVIIGALIAFVPLLTFVPQLIIARQVGRREYGGLVTDYSRRFQARWISEGSRADLLGTSDIQSLTDLGTSYRENVEKMQVLPFGSRDCLLLFTVSQIPAVPILLAELPAREVLKRLLHFMIGGMPG